MLEKSTRNYQGGCLCGAIRYEVRGQPLVVAHCHCEDCQRSSGAGHSTGAMFPVDRFRLTGQTAEYELVSDKGTKVTRVFCPACGSPVFGCNTGMVGYVTITLGTLDDASGFAPQVVIFDRNRKPWDTMDESLPTFAAQPDWQPGDDV